MTAPEFTIVVRQRAGMSRSPQTLHRATCRYATQSDWMRRAATEAEVDEFRRKSPLFPDRYRICQSCKPIN